MTNYLEQLDKAIELWDDILGHHPGSDLAYYTILNAASAYRDLLANGAEPDYEAAAKVLARQDGFRWDAYATKYQQGWRERVQAIVDAAIGDRLLVDHPEEGT